MEFEEDSYDAATPLDLFRVNEKINARKRRWLNAEIRNFPLRGKNESRERLSSIVLNMVMTLAEQGKVIIYEQPLQLSQEIASQNDDLLQQVNQEISRLQATGQIDINTDITITFTGDKRVLADLQMLAENGYGEDSFGNNVPLPKTLGYLRR
jgi:predicted site-specific integrase-resolvase